MPDKDGSLVRLLLDYSVGVQLPSIAPPQAAAWVSSLSGNGLLRKGLFNRRACVDVTEINRALLRALL